MKNKILVTQSSMPSYEEYCEEIKDIWETKWLTNNGEKHVQLEENVKKYLNCKNISLFCNGHLALFTGLKILNLNGEVITTPYTFASTTHAIVQAGLKPVFCDIDPNDFTIDDTKIESLINENTCAICAVHVYGLPCHVENIEKIAKKYNLKVIYDAAHAFGVEVNGKGIANYADISMFSFHATKVFNTIEGGCLAYNDNYKEIIEQFKNFGIANHESVSEVGINAKMNEFSAAMGICNLRHIDGEIAKREKIYERYVRKLENIDGLKIIHYSDNMKPNYAYFPVVFDKEKYGLDRNEVMDLLAKHNIFSRKYFYPLISDFDCYKEIYDSCKTPVAKYISDNVLTLPMYADLNLKDVDLICKIIKDKK